MGGEGQKELEYKKMIEALIGRREAWEDWQAKNKNIAEYDFEYLDFVHKIKLEKAIFNKGVDFNNTTFIEEADFWKAKFKMETYFQKTKFKMGANFTEAMFIKGVDFWQAEFKMRANFSQTAFVENADFWQAKFEMVSNFNKATFKDFANFEEAAFTENADFQEAKFEMMSNFNKATFKDFANFAGAKFTEWTYFVKTAFAEVVYFVKATFAEEVDFSEATFAEEANFKEAKFSKQARFLRADFFEDVNFQQVDFTEGANFKEADFSKGVGLSHARFQDSIFFNGATFYGDKIDFSQVILLPNSSLIFTGAIFDNAVPDFRYLDRIPDIRFHDFSVPSPDELDPEKKWRSIILQLKFHRKRKWDEGNADRYRKLKELAIGNHNHEYELIFYGYEMESKLKNFYKKEWRILSAKWFMDIVPTHFYKWVSNYGQSVGRPFAILLVLFILFNFKTILPLPLFVYDLIEKKQIDDINLWIKTIATIFWFLLFLGLRNRFKIK